MRRSRRDIDLGRRLVIGQWWRDREDGTAWRVAQVHRADCHVDLADTAGGLRALTFAQLRAGFDQLVPADKEVA